MKKALVVCHMGRHYRKFGQYDIKTLLNMGYEVEFAANFNLEIDKVNDKSIKIHQVDFQRSPFSLKNIKAYRQLKKIINSNQYDLIHCQSPVGGVLARLAAKKTRKKNKTKVIYTAHGFHFYKGSSFVPWIIFYPIEWLLAKNADTIVTINKEDYNLAKNKFSKRCNNIVYIPGIGIELEKFNIRMNRSEQEEYKKSLGLDKEDFVFTCIGRLDRNKNQIFLIQIMERLVKKNEHFHLLLVGADDLNGEYQEYARKKNLTTNIHFLGNRDDVPQILNITDIVVSSSKREGLPVNIIEAFASANPVVALKCRGMEDLIENGENGYIVNNLNEFIKKIGEIINDNKLKNRISTKNRKKAADFSYEVVNEYVKKIFIL